MTGDNLEVVAKTARQEDMVVKFLSQGHNKIKREQVKKRLS